MPQIQHLLFLPVLHHRERQHEGLESGERRRPRRNSDQCGVRRRSSATREHVRDPGLATQFPAAPFTRASSNVHTLFRGDDKSKSQDDSGHVDPSAASDGGGIGVKHGLVVQPTTPEADKSALAEQTTPKLGTGARLSNQREARNHGEASGGKGSGRNGGESVSRSPHRAGGAAATARTSAANESVLVRRNDSILKALFSGDPDAAAGLSGDASGHGLSYEFGLWKRAKKKSPMAALTRAGVDSALPPPPLQGPNASGVSKVSFPTPFTPEAVLARTEVIARRGDGTVAVQIGRSSRRPSPPPGRASATLPGFIKPQDDTQSAQRIDGGDAGIDRRDSDSQNFAPALARGASAPVLSARSLISDGAMTLSGNSPHLSSLQRYSQPHGRASPPLPSPRLSPRAALAKTRPCIVASVSYDSGQNTRVSGLLRGLKASLRPSSRRGSPTFRFESGEGQMKAGAGGEEIEGNRSNRSSSRSSWRSGASGGHRLRKDIAPQACSRRADLTRCPLYLNVEGIDPAR